MLIQVKLHKDFLKKKKILFKKYVCANFRTMNLLHIVATFLIKFFYIIFLLLCKIAIICIDDI